MGITRLRYGRVASPLRLHRPTLRTTLVGLAGAVGLAAINFAVMFLPLDGGPAGGIADGPAWAQLVFAVLFGVVVTGPRKWSCAVCWVSDSAASMTGEAIGVSGGR